MPANIWGNVYRRYNDVMSMFPVDNDPISMGTIKLIAFKFGIVLLKRYYWSKQALAVVVALHSLNCNSSLAVVKGKHYNDDWIVIIIYLSPLFPWNMSSAESFVKPNFSFVIPIFLVSFSVCLWSSNSRISCPRLSKVFHDPCNATSIVDVGCSDMITTCYDIRDF